jgi:hypothetical protein
MIGAGRKSVMPVRALAVCPPQIWKRTRRTARAHSHDGDVVGVEVLAKSVVGRAAPAVGGNARGRPGRRWKAGDCRCRGAARRSAAYFIPRGRAPRSHPRCAVCRSYRSAIFVVTAHQRTLLEGLREPRQVARRRQHPHGTPALRVADAVDAALEDRPPPISMRPSLSRCGSDCGSVRSCLLLLLAHLLATLRPLRLTKASLCAGRQQADPAGWDRELLPMELQVLTALDFDIEVTKFLACGDRPCA